MSTSEQVEGDELERTLNTGERGVLVDFWSPWCAPCRTLKPHLNRLADEHKDVWRFIGVNGASDTVTAARFSVRAFPTLIYFKGGQEVARVSGAVSLGTLVENLGTFA